MLLLEAARLQAGDEKVGDIDLHPFEGIGDDLPRNLHLCPHPVEMTRQRPATTAPEHRQDVEGGDDHLARDHLLAAGDGRDPRNDVEIPGGGPACDIGDRIAHPGRKFMDSVEGSQWQPHWRSVFHLRTARWAPRGVRVCRLTLRAAASFLRTTPPETTRATVEHRLERDDATRNRILSCGCSFRIPAG